MSRDDGGDEEEEGDGGGEVGEEREEEEGKEDISEGGAGASVAESLDANADEPEVDGEEEEEVSKIEAARVGRAGVAGSSSSSSSSYSSSDANAAAAAATALEGTYDRGVAIFSPELVLHAQEVWDRLAPQVHAMHSGSGKESLGGATCTLNSELRVFLPI